MLLDTMAYREMYTMAYLEVTTLGTPDLSTGTLHRLGLAPVPAGFHD